MVIGRDKSLVQGPGGNVSIKVNDGRMLVKASGYRLDGVSEKSGLVLVDYNLIRSFFTSSSNNLSLCQQDDSIFEVFKSAVINSSSRPSMETGFHAVLGKAVVHTHPIFVNLLGSMVGGRKIAEEIGLECRFVPYISPGYALASCISSFFNMTFLLQNHGLIVSGTNLETCVDKTVEINEAIKKHFGLSGFDVQECLIRTKDGFLNNGERALRFVEYTKKNPEIFSTYLFPDAVIYVGDIGSERSKISITDGGILYRLSIDKAKSINETVEAHIYLLETIPRFGTIRSLTSEDVSYLLSMKAERYRREIRK